MPMSTVFVDALANNVAALVTHIGLVNGAGTEISGGGYARQPVTWTGASAGIVRPTANLVFSVAGGTTVAGWRGYSALSGGSDYGGQSVTPFAFGNAGTYTLLSASTGIDLDSGSAFTAASVFAPQLPSLLTVSIGNSLNAGGNQGNARDAASSGWATGGPLHLCNAWMGGTPLVYGRITASTRADSWGAYAYSGATLATILTDLPAQLWTPLVTAGLQPDLIVAQDLTVNDIVADASTAQIQARVTQFVRDCRSRYPGAILWLMTPHPSANFNTTGRQTVYAEVAAWMLALDNGVDIFVTQASAYEDPASPARPLSGYTVDGVHPNVAGGFANARKMLPTLQRIRAAGKLPYRCTSSNHALIGTATASGANISGTWATGMSATVANSTAVFTALQPGVSLAYTQTAGQTADMGTVAVTTTPVSGFVRYSPFIRLRIDSGASQVRSIALQPRGSDGTTNTFFNYQNGSTAWSDPGAEGYADGEEITLRCPPLTQADFGAAGVLTQIMNYLRVTRKTGGAGATTVLSSGTVSLTILDSGVGLVA